MNVTDQAKRHALRRRATISGIALVCAFIGVVIAGAVSSRDAQIVRSETALRSQLYRYNAKLRNLLTLLKDAETGELGYLLLGHATYLQPYRDALTAAPAVLTGLQTIPVSDPVLTDHVLALQKLAQRKLTRLTASIRLRDTGQYDGALALVEEDVDEHSTQRVRDEVAASIAVIQKRIDACDVQVLQATLWGERFEALALAALLLCGLFAVLQIGSLLRAQRRYEEELGASERRHRAIVEDQTELIAISRTDGALEFVNPAYAEFFGFPASDLEGRSLYDFLSAADRAEWLERMAVMLTTDDCLLRVQLLGARREKNSRWISWRHRAQRSATGELRIHSVGRDITVNKRAEEELKAREHFLSRIGLVAGVGGWSMDLRTQAVHWSPLTRKIHEVPDWYEPKYETALTFYPPRAQVLLRQAVEAAIEENTQYDLELPLITAAGRHVWVRAVGEAERDEEGNAIRLVGALQDVTERKAIERSLRELTEVFDNTPDFVAQTDWRGLVTFLNPAARQAVGLGLTDSIKGRTFAEFYPPETVAQFMNVIVPRVKEQGVWVGESKVALAGGRILPVDHMVIGHRDAVGRLTRYTSLMRDISLEVQNRQELVRKTATLNAIVDAIPAMLAVWDRNVRYQLVNRAFEGWRSAARDELLGATMEQAMGADEFNENLPWVERALGGETVVFERDYPQAHENRHMSVTYTPLHMAGGEVDGFIELRQDITQSREERQRLVGLSEHDPLTGLLNRAGFEAYLAETMARGEGSALAALYVDLDHFKPVNDLHGHATGDEVLRQFAARLKAAVRPTDAVARLGGDEFGIVLLGVLDPSHAGTVAGKIIEAASLPFEVGTKTLHISASVGAAYNADLFGGWRGLLARADEKVYEAKAAGRNRHVLADFGETNVTNLSDRLVG